MVGSVNRVAAPERAQWPGTHRAEHPGLVGNPGDAAPATGPGPEPQAGSPLAAAERLGYAKLSQISGVLLSLASARTSGRDVAASALQAAGQKLRRLKAEVLAVAASGDIKAATRIAEALTEVAREVADAARDYAAAGGDGALTQATLAEAAAAIDVGAAPERDAGSSDMPRAAAGLFADVLNSAMGLNAAAADDPGAASPHPAAADTSDLPRSPLEDAPYPGALLRHESDDRIDDGGVQADAHAMLDEALALKRTMRRVMARQSAAPARIDPAIQTDIAASGARPSGIWPRVF